MNRRDKLFDFFFSIWLEKKGAVCTVVVLKLERDTHSGFVLEGWTTNFFVQGCLLKNISGTP